MPRRPTDREYAVIFVNRLLVTLFRQFQQRALDIRNNRHQQQFQAVMDWLRKNYADHRALRVFLPLPITGVYARKHSLLRSWVA